MDESAQGSLTVAAVGESVGSREERRVLGARPWLLIVFCGLFVLLLLDAVGISLVREWPVPSDRVQARAPLPPSEPPPGVHEQAATMPISDEDGPTPSAVPSAKPKPSPSLSPSPSPSAAVVARPTATPSSVETPQEIEVRTPDETPSEVQTSPVVVGPPENAHFAGDSGQIVLGWPAGSAQKWHVEVTAAGRPWSAQDVTTPTATVKVTPGPLYHWRVTAGGLGEVVPWRSFQYSDVMRIDYNGAEGRKGRSGRSAGEIGRAGAEGASGQDVEVWVDNVDGFIRVRTETARGAKETLWLVPNSSPLRISAAGGAGGRGGHGADGRQALVATRYGYSMSDGSGSAGGDGGKGGNGGTITLHAPPELEKYVQLDVSAGAAGAPGSGGAGTQSLGSAPGANGNPGEPGQPGQPGKIVRSP